MKFTKRKKLVAVAVAAAVVLGGAGIGLYNSGFTGTGGGFLTAGVPCVTHINGGYDNNAVPAPVPGAPGAVFTYRGGVNRVTINNAACKTTTIPANQYPQGTLSFYSLSPTIVPNVLLTRTLATYTITSGSFAGVTVGEAVLGDNIVGNIQSTPTTVISIQSATSITLSAPPSGLSVANPTITENLIFQPYYPSVNDTVPSTPTVVVANVVLNSTNTATVISAYPVSPANATSNFNNLTSYSSHWNAITVSSSDGGVPSGTTISSVASGGGSLTLSANATTSAVVTLTFTLPTLCSVATSPTGGDTLDGNATGTCTVASNLNPATEQDAANVWDVFTSVDNSIFVNEVDQNFTATTQVQTFVYTNTNAYTSATSCGTSGTVSCAWDNTLTYYQNIANNAALQGNLTISAPVKLVGEVLINDAFPWGNPGVNSEVDFQMNVPGAITVNVNTGVASNTTVSLTGNPGGLCAATFIGNDYTNGVSLYGCTITLNTFTATGPTTGCQNPNPTTSGTCVGISATTTQLTMAPSVTNTADPLKNPYHGVFNYSKITGSFCGFGCILQQTGTYNGKINLTPWASASGTGNGGTVPPLVPSNCTADITAELAAGTGGHWSGTTWDGGNGCYQIPYGVTISTSGVTIQNATVYDSQVQNATTTAGTVGGFIPTFKIEGGGTGGKNGGWTPGGSNPAWTYIGANNVTMKNITVIGANQTGGYTPANVSAHAFAAQSSSGDNFDNIFTENTWGDSLYTFYGGSGNPSPPTTNLNVCNDGTPNCTYKVYNSGRDPITLNDMQGSGKSSWEHGTVNGVDTKFGPSTINNASLLGASGQGNAFAFESDLTGVGLAYPTLIYINNSNWQGLIRFTTYNQGTTIFNNDTSISGIQVLGGNSVTNGGGGPGATVIFNGGSYAYPNSPGILVRDEATTVFNQTLFPVAAGANTAWSVLNSSSLTFHTGNGKYFPPPPAGKNDSTSTVSVLPN